MQSDAGSASVEGEMVELIPALKRFARRFCGSSIEAEDLVQDTILKALSNLPRT